MQEVSVRELRERFQSKHDLYTYMQNNRKWKINSFLTLICFRIVRYLLPMRKVTTFTFMLQILMGKKIA